MKSSTAICLLLCLFSFGFSDASAQSTGNNWGIGFRLGDPSGITVKRYLSRHALELNIGRTRMWYRNAWYDDRFYHWYDKRNFGYKDFRYEGYRASVPIGLQLHYLLHNNMVTTDKGALDLYYGGGGQLRAQRYYFDYRYKWQGDDDWYWVRGEEVTDIDVGIDGVLGIEYRFAEAPIGVFVDGNLFMEVADNPFAFWLQGGVGARYNF